jgi:hypothetical protein
LTLKKITGPCKAAACWKVSKCGCREEHAVEAEAGVWWGLHFQAGGNVQGHGTEQGHQHCIQAGKSQPTGFGLGFVVDKVALGYASSEYFGFFHESYCQCSKLICHHPRCVTGLTSQYLITAANKFSFIVIAQGDNHYEMRINQVLKMVFPDWRKSVNFICFPPVQYVVKIQQWSTGAPM